MSIFSRSPTLRGAVPLGLAPSLAVPLPAHATLTETFGGPGGAHFASMCPSGTVLAGLHARTGGWVDAVAPICARIDPVSQKLQRPCRTQGESGGTGGSVQERFCDGERPVKLACGGGEVATGLQGRAGAYLDALGLACGPVPPSRGLPGTVMPAVRLR